MASVYKNLITNKSKNEFVKLRKSLSTFSFKNKKDSKGLDRNKKSSFGSEKSKFFKYMKLLGSLGLISRNSKQRHYSNINFLKAKSERRHRKQHSTRYKNRNEEENFFISHSVYK